MHVAVPGILWAAIQVRYAELQYRGFSPYAVELVCYDLRQRFPHILTLPLSFDPPEKQDAADHPIVAYYEPGRPRDQGLLLRLLRGEVTGPLPVKPWAPANPGPLSNHRDHIRFPRRLRECIRTRWRELGYKRLSHYVTAVIRYDLALAGPHRYFNGADTDPEILAALDAETLATFQEGKPQRIRLIELIEEEIGRTLTDQEAMEEIANLLKKLRALAERK